MKKSKKRIIVIIIAIFILLLGISLYFYSPAFTMNVASTGKINNTDIYAVKNGYGNMFFVKTSNGYILIDAGLSSRGFEKDLKDIGIDPIDVKWIFLTHSDSDHTGTLPLFKNAKIYMSEDEYQLIDGTIKRMAFTKNAMPSGIDIAKIVRLSNDQKLVVNGTEIECIKAPGHTNGSMLYRINGKYLFTGDVFKLRNGNMDVHPFSMNKKLSVETINQLKDVIKNSQIVLTSHYGILKY